jgi:glucose-6-phosphate isomerase
LPVPKEVGGRFSVFSAVGLFPLTLAGFDTEQLLLGARDALASSLQKENHALRLAESIYLAHKGGASILNFFFFNPELESLGKWARQLYAESLGKEKDKGGKVVRAGLTPIVSIGSTDLHSMAQLYFGGPHDKMTLFVHVAERSRLHVPEKGLFVDVIPVIKNKSPEAIMKAIYDGTTAAYSTHKLPCGEILLPAISPYALGMFFELHMMAVMYLGEMLHVNTFDQPNVEDYKRVTKEILENLN